MTFRRATFDIIEKDHLFQTQDLFSLPPLKTILEIFKELLVWGNSTSEAEPPSHTRHRADTVSSSAFYSSTPLNIQSSVRLRQTQHNLTFEDRVTSRHILLTLFSATIRNTLLHISVNTLQCHTPQHTVTHLC